MDDTTIPLDYLSDNVTLQWLDDKRIAILSVKGSHRKDVVIWANKVEELVNTWRTDSPYAVLHDVRYVFMSPYARSQAQKVTTIAKEKAIRGRYAVVVSDNVFGQTIAMFVNLTLRKQADDLFIGQCFTSRDDALAWLREQF